MAVTYVGKGTVGAAINANAAPTLPSGIAVGDYMLMFVESANENVGAVTPSGWTPLNSGTFPGFGTAGGTAATRLSVYGKFCTTTNETIPSLGDYGDHTQAIIAAWRGVSSVGPVAVASDAAASTTCSFPALTTTTDNNCIVHAFSWLTDATTAISASNSLTNAGLTGLAKDHDAGNTSGNGGGIFIGHGFKAVAGAIGTTTITTTSVQRPKWSIALVPDTTAPTITSSNAVNVDENAPLSHTLTANETVTWTKTGGADQLLFGLNNGILSLTAKNHEAPVDADANNTYVVQVTATDASGNATNQTITVTVIDVDDVGPVFTSSNAVSVAENAVLAHTLTATDMSAITYSIVGGADQARFELSGSTLRWLSNGTKDFEAPNDADANNTYVVIVRATDASSNFSEQTITVTVTNVGEALPVFSPPYNVNVREGESIFFVPTHDGTGGFMVSDATNPLSVDYAKFTQAGGAITWANNAAQDYDNPGDANADNVYEVVWRADNANGSTDQVYTFTVIDDLTDNAGAHGLSTTNRSSWATISLGNLATHGVDGIGGEIAPALGISSKSSGKWAVEATGAGMSLGLVDASISLNPTQRLYTSIGTDGSGGNLDGPMVSLLNGFAWGNGRDGRVQGVNLDDNVDCVSGGYIGTTPQSTRTTLLVDFDNGKFYVARDGVFYGGQNPSIGKGYNIPTGIAAWRVAAGNGLANDWVTLKFTGLTDSWSALGFSEWGASIVAGKYKGARGRAAIYLGVRSDAQLNLGPTAMGWV